MRTSAINMRTCFTLSQHRSQGQILVRNVPDFYLDNELYLTKTVNIYFHRDTVQASFIMNMKLQLLNFKDTTI